MVGFLGLALYLGMSLCLRWTSCHYNNNQDIKDYQSLKLSVFFGWMCFALVKVHYEGALTMFFAANAKLPFNSIEVRLTIYSHTVNEQEHKQQQLLLQQDDKQLLCQQQQHQKQSQQILLQQEGLSLYPEYKLLVKEGNENAVLQAAAAGIKGMEDQLSRMETDPSLTKSNFVKLLDGLKEPGTFALVYAAEVQYLKLHHKYGY